MKQTIKGDAKKGTARKGNATTRKEPPTVAELKAEEQIDRELELQRIEETKRIEAEFNALENTEDGDDPDLIFKTATYKDARRIANGATLQSKEWDDEEIGDLLALMYALTYCEKGEREGILYEVVLAFMPSMDVAHKATHSLVVGRLQADQGGAK